MVRKSASASRSTMGLSISARILVGFTLVLLAFGGVMTFSIYRMDRLRQDLDLITRSYLTKLDPILADLRTTQRDLLNTVDRWCQGASASFQRKQTRNQVLLALLFREKRARQALKVLRSSHELNPGEEDSRFLARFGEQLVTLRGAFRRNRPIFERLFGSDSGGGDLRVRSMGTRLLRSEAKLDTRIKLLRMDLQRRIKAAGSQVEEEQQRTILAVLVLVLVAALVSLVVTLRSRRTLRPLKTLVTGTERLGSGDFTHRVEVTSKDELGLLAQAFNKMAADIETREQRLILSERMATAGQIASHITHEIRNPLSSISLNTELLEEEMEQGLDGERAADARNLCQAMRREVDRLTEITEEYLRFGRLPRPHLEEEDVNEILTNLIAFISGELQERGVAVVPELKRPLPLVQADENQLRQAFLNLMRNAGEAMAGEGGGELAVSTRAPDSQVEVRIADTGPGIASEDLAKIFEPFFSTKESGTGLGLALTHRIIHEHGGSIDVRSAPGEGTIFIIRLPRAATSPEEGNA